MKRRLFAHLSWGGLVGLLIVASPAPAFHGTPYTAVGTAEQEDVTVGAVVQWSGESLTKGKGVFLVTLADPVLGLLLPSAPLQGAEQFANLHWTQNAVCLMLEVAEYLGYDTLTNGEAFRIEGRQENCLVGAAAGQRYMPLSGHYAEFHLELVVGHPWIVAA